MTSTLRTAILARAEQDAQQGVAMGAMVDDLVRDGHAVEAIEEAVWELMAARRLTPAGFVCRIVRRRGDDGSITNARAYELLLAPWSPELDRQLDLGLGGTKP